MNLTSSSVDDYFGLKRIRSRIILQPAEFDGQAISVDFFQRPYDIENLEKTRSGNGCFDDIGQQ